jgi:O-antigen/teichoic acid export membrane protein
LTVIFRRHVQTILTDTSFKRLASNAGTLLGGNVFQSLLVMLALALTARGLGAHAFGLFVLAISYVTIVSQAVGFQSWQAIIRYAAEARAQNDAELLGGLIKTGLTFDVIGAAAATGVALIGIAVGTVLSSIPEELRTAALLYSITLAININGAPIAVLRIYDNYKAFVVQGAVYGLVRLGATGTAWLLDGGLLHFIMAAAMAQITASLTLLFLALRELRRRELVSFLHESVRNTLTTKPEFRRFFLLTNFNSTARMIRELDLPLIGLVAGPAFAGEFRIARQIGSALQKIIDPFFHAIYPDLSRLVAEGDSRGAMRLMRHSGMVLGGIGSLILLLFGVFGKDILLLILGPEFDVYWATVWCVGAAAVWAFVHPIVPMLTVYERQRALLTILISSSVCYLGAAFLAAMWGGAVGASAAYFGFITAYSLMIVRLLCKSTRSRWK